MTIAIIDLGIGNCGSIATAFQRLKTQSIITNQPREIALADKIVFPGVGSFDTAVKALKKFELEEVLKEQILGQKKPLLGICLGMQLLAQSSEEGSLAGLGLLPAKVVRFTPSENGIPLRVPHMGWNTVRSVGLNSLTKDLPLDARFYFVHSYHFQIMRDSFVAGLTRYGSEFPSIVQQDNIMGVQFHPEKSHRYGMAIFKNFVEMT